MSVIPLVGISKDHPLHDAIIEHFLPMCKPHTLGHKIPEDQYTWIYKSVSSPMQCYGIGYTISTSVYESSRYFKSCMLEDLNVQS